MTRTALNPGSITASPFYSHGIEVRDAGRLVFVSGQVGVTSDGQVPEGVEGQATQAIRNLHAVLDSAGLTPEDLVKLTIYLIDPADIPSFVSVAASALTDAPPATTMLMVSGLSSPDLRVEIEAVAAR